MYNLDGRVSLVTGAAGRRGIGHAIATRLAKEGSDVVVVDKFVVPPRSEEIGWQGLNSVVEEIKSLGRQALVFSVDITQVQEVDGLVNKTLARFGKIDILVNNAGVSSAVGREKELKDFTDEAWHTTLAVNLTGTFFCCRAVAREMVTRGEGGKIINISSIRGKVGERGQGAYTASKFGVIGLTQVLALELAPYKINVNAVCPGPVDTDILSDLLHIVAEQQSISLEEARSKVWEERFGPSLSDIPLRRLGTPDDIAGVVAFPASREADYITGQAINVDGGLVMSH